MGIKRIKEADLKQTVFILYDMEINNYLMTRAIRKLNDKIAPLGFEKNYAPPVKKRSKVSFFENFSVISLSAISIGAILGALVGIFAAFDTFPFIGIFTWLFFGILFAAFGAATGFVAAIVIAIAIAIILKSIKNKKNEALYQKEYAKYQEKVAADKQRLDSEHITKQTLTEQIDELKEKLAISKELLLDFYERSNITEDIRHIVPIGYMYEYTKLGTASTLEELCDLVRNDIKSNVTKATLNVLSDVTDESIEQEHEIYRELLKLNDQCDMMVNMVTQSITTDNKTAKSTVISTYSFERTKKEAEYQSYMMLLFY